MSLTADGIFLGNPVMPREKLAESKADAIIVCLYDRNNPMSINYLPEDLSKTDNMYWVFQKNGEKHNTQVDTEPIKKYIQKENSALPAGERMEEFATLQKNAFENISHERREKIKRRNRRERVVKIYESFDDEEQAEQQRRSGMSISERLHEFSILQERAWGRRWTNTSITKQVAFEKLDWA